MNLLQSGTANIDWMLNFDLFLYRVKGTGPGDSIKFFDKNEYLYVKLRTSTGF
jgi:hypothetical protein